MEQLEEVPKGWKPTLTNGQITLHLSDKEPELAVLLNEVSKTVVKLPLQSALARGYWQELPKS